MRERLHIGLGLRQRGHRLGRRDDMHQAGAGGEGGARGHACRPAHAGVAPDDHHPAALALVIAAAEPAQPLGGLRVGHQRRPGGIRRRVADVHHDDGAHLVAGEQVAPPQAAERDRQVGPRARRARCPTPGRRRSARRSRRPAPRGRGSAPSTRPSAPAARRARRCRAAHPPPGRRWATGRRARPPARRPPARVRAIASRSSAAGPGGAVTHTGTSSRWSARATTQPSPPLWPGPAAIRTPSRSRWA